MMEESDIHPDVVSQEGISIYHIIRFRINNAMWHHRLSMVALID